MQRFAGWALGLLVVVLGLACATIATNRHRTVDFILENHGWDQAVVRLYVRGVQAGRYVVPGVSADTVTVRYQVADDLDVTIRKLGEDRVWRIPNTMVKPGDVVTVTIMEHAPNSSVAVLPVGQDYWLHRYDHPGGVLFSGLRKIHPPYEYVEWWREAEKCVGGEASFATIRWFSAHTMVGTVGGLEDMEVVAYRGLRWKRNIYLLERALGSERLIKHEAIHYILEHARGIEYEQNAAHDHRAFTDCVGGEAIKGPPTGV